MMYTLTNNFHHTATKIRLSGDGPYYSISRRAMRRAWKALCGMEECTCGNEFGCRPTEQIHIHRLENDSVVISLA